MKNKRIKYLAICSLIFFSCSKHADTRRVNTPMHSEEKVSLIPLGNGLFDSDELIELEIRSDFPYRSYKGSDNKPEVTPELFPFYVGKILISGSEKPIPVKIQARGNSKLYLCDFAPVVIEFDKKNDNQIFVDAGKKIKLATHCDEGTSIAQRNNPVVDGQKADEYVMKEYLAYKITEMLMPESSLKTRLAKIKYTDNDGNLIAYKYAYFFEHRKNFYKRNSNYQALDTWDQIELFYQNVLGHKYSRVFSDETKYLDRNSLEDRKKIAENNSKILNVLNIENYIRFRFVDRILVAADRSNGLFSGNTLTMLDENKKILRLHFDFDRSHFVGKFDQHAINLQDDPSKSLTENFANQINNLCNVDSSPGSPNFDINMDFYLDLDSKRQACKDVAQQFKEKDLDAKITQMINSFEHLNKIQKEGILNRVDSFFKTLDQFIN